MRKEYRQLAVVLGTGALCCAVGAFASTPLLLLPAVGLPLAGGWLLKRADARDVETEERLNLLERRFGCDSKDVYFSHLIHGGFYRTIEDVIQEGKPLGFTFSTNRFVVLVAHLERWGETFSDDASPMNAEAVRHTFFVLRNVFSDLLNRKNLQYDAEVDGEHVCIVSVFQDSEEALYEELRSCAAQAVEFLENEFGISVTVAISRVCDGLFSLPQAYNECQQILEFHRLSENDVQVSMFSDIRTDELVPQPVNFARLQAQILSCIRASDYTGAREAIRFFCAEESAGILHDANSLRFRLFGTINTILTVLDELKPTFSEAFYETLGLPDALLSCQTMAELLEQSDLLFGKLIAAAEQERRETAPPWVAAMRQYIDENYTDPNLSVYGAAEKFSISASHCSRVFKQHTGMGALEYIQRRRLEHAKQLMGKGLSVKQIAEASGFSNALMMNRAFKRFEGTTPSKF